MKKIKKICILTFIVGFLCACGKTETTDQLFSSEVTENATTNVLSDCVGEWICVASTYGDTQNSSLYIARDEYLTSNLSIYEEERNYKMDFLEQQENYSVEIYGKNLLLESGSAYDGCPNTDWYASYMKKTDEASETSYYLTMTDADTLEVTKIYTYEDGDEPYYNHFYYKRKGCNLEDEEYQYRYPDELVVSNVEELYQALGSNRKIILKAGTYNISEFPKETDTNQHVNWRYDYIYDDTYEDGYTYDFMHFEEEQLYCYDINNMILEGEAGAEVHICTEDPLVAPLAFSSCQHITLNNLKIGHMVEPGFCSGAVTYFSESHYIDIKNCRLYGCGTFGISALNCSAMNITDSDIYECSYGLVALSECYSFHFSNCTLRDSKDMSMFQISDCDNISFTQCEITGNDSSAYAPDPFISCVNCYDTITFENCHFANNKYEKLNDDTVKLINCQIED